MSDINELNSLWEEKADVELKLKVMENQEAALRADLKEVVDAKTGLIRRKQEIQDQAAQLCEVLFGKPVVVKEPVMAMSVQPQTPQGTHVPDNSIIEDRSAPAATGDKHVDAVTKLGGFAF